MAARYRPAEASGTDTTSLPPASPASICPEGRMGCLMVNSAMELAAEDSEVSHVVRDHMARLERNATRALRNAKRRGEIPKHIQPAAKATQLMATALGLMVVGKTNPGRHVLETIVETAFAELR